MQLGHATTAALGRLDVEVEVDAIAMSSDEDFGDDVGAQRSERGHNDIGKTMGESIWKETRR